MTIRIHATSCATLAALTISLLIPLSAHAASAPEVHDSAALAAAVATAQPGTTTTIYLARDFSPVAAPAALSIPASAKIVIAGEAGSTLTRISKDPTDSRPHFVFSGDTDSSLTIQDIHFAGQNEVSAQGESLGTSRGGGIQVSNAALTLSNTMFTGIIGPGAVSLSGSVGPLVVENSSFLGNSSGSGSALSLSTGTGPTTITNSTFIHNSGTAPGYPGGAITSKDSRLPVTIRSSLFRANSSVLRGGAIALDYFGSDFTVDSSVFEDNVITDDGAGKSTADGGAIAVTARISAPFPNTSISASTFSGNLAQDEGGAMLVQTGANSATVIKNSTFFENVSLGLQANYDDVSGGGAIEFFGTPATLEHNTFVNNRAERGKLLLGVSQRGAAISGYGSGSDWPAQPLTLSYNVFSGNFVTNSSGKPDLNNKFRQVFSSKGLLLPHDPEAPFDLEDDALPDHDSIRGTLESNVGVDNGSLLPQTVNNKSVLGSETPVMRTNASPVLSGDPRWAGTTTSGLVNPKSFVVFPNDDPYLGGLADGITLGRGDITADSRGFAVDTPNADAGSVQSSWVRFDSNGGHWQNLPPHEFDGERFYDDAVSEVSRIWSVAPIASVRTLEAAPSLAPKPGLVFREWNTAADGSGTGYSARSGLRLSPSQNLILYAIWIDPVVSTSSVETRFETASGTTIATPIRISGLVGSSYSTNPAEVPGYRLVLTPHNASGVFTVDPVSVVYLYESSGTSPSPAPPDTSTSCTVAVEGCGVLPTTGASVGAPVFVAAGALIAIGAFFLVLFRLRRRP